MNFTALDIIHFWTDSRRKTVQKIFPTNGKVCVYCTRDLSTEAAKVCHFIHLIVQQPWTFQMKYENECYVITFFPETINLKNLFQEEKRRNTKKSGNERTRRNDRATESK